MFRLGILEYVRDAQLQAYLAVFLLIHPQQMATLEYLVSLIKKVKSCYVRRWIPQILSTYLRINGAGRVDGKQHCHLSQKEAYREQLKCFVIITF